MEIIQRPWGTFRIIEQGDNYKIKQIEVFPHCRTSLQFHRYRSENMIVVSGSLYIYCRNKTRVYHTGEYCHIAMGENHRLQNDSNIIVSLIEVQTGSILEESDIVRIEDDYGREEK